MGDYEGTYEKEITIAKAELTVKTPSAEKVYDGKALTAAKVNDGAAKAADDEATLGVMSDGQAAPAKVSDGTATLPNGETLAFEVTGSQTKVGKSDNTYAITWAADGNAYTAKESNYKVTADLGTLKVTEADGDSTSKDTTPSTITKGSSTTSTSTAKTADEAPAGGLLLVSLMSMAAFLVAGWRRRREDARVRK
jgi:hypothetical protein